MFAHVHFPGTLRPGHTRLQNVFFFRVRGNPRRSMKKGTCSDLHAYASTPYAPFFARFMFFFLWIFFGLFICFYAHFMLRFSVFCSKFRLRIFVVFQHLFAFSAHFLLIFCSFFFCVSLCFSARFSPLSSPPFSRYPRLYFGPKYIPVPHVDNWTTPHISFSYVMFWVYFSARIFTCVFLLLYQCKIPHDQ